MPLTEDELEKYAERVASLLKWFAVVHDRLVVLGEEQTEVFRRTEQAREALFELWRVTKRPEGPTSADVSSGPSMVPAEGYPDLSRYSGPKRGRKRRSGGRPLSFNAPKGTDRVV